MQELLNIYAHNMYALENDYLVKKLKTEWREISLEEINSNLELLREVYRQLFDSVVGYNELYISKRPKLLR